MDGWFAIDISDLQAALLDALDDEVVPLREAIDTVGFNRDRFATPLRFEPEAASRIPWVFPVLAVSLAVAAWSTQTFALSAILGMLAALATLYAGIFLGLELLTPRLPLVLDQEGVHHGPRVVPWERIRRVRLHTVVMPSRNPPSP